MFEATHGHTSSEEAGEDPDMQQPISNPRAWLFRVTRNLLIDQFHDRLDGYRIPLEAAHENLSSALPPADNVQLNDFEVA